MVPFCPWIGYVTRSPYLLAYLSVSYGAFLPMDWMCHTLAVSFSVSFGRVPFCPWCMVGRFADIYSSNVYHLGLLVILGVGSFASYNICNLKNLIYPKLPTFNMSPLKGAVCWVGRKWDVK